MAEVKRILVATDFSAASARALDFAVDMARRYSAAIELLHVLEDPIYGTLYPDAYFVDLEGLRQQLSADAQQRLRDEASRHAGAGVAIATHLIVGRPAAVILEQAKALGADAIVLGTHGRSGFQHLVLGSVAERVVRSASCPVITIREPAARRS
jgi:nucleotide-binding universal stress UspA family protein